PLPVAAEVDIAAARCPRGVGHRGRLEFDVGGGHADAAAGFTRVLPPRQQAAAAGGDAGAAVQRYAAVAFDQGVGADHAVVVEHRVEQGVGALGGEGDAAAVGGYAAAVADGGAQGRFVHRDFDQAVADQVEADAVARRQRHA